MLVIGIAGGSASGKSKLVKKLLEKVPQDKVNVLPQDTYYKDGSNLSLEERFAQNFDHPDAIEFDLLAKHVVELKAGDTIQVPSYSITECIRNAETTIMTPKPVLIVEGILIYAHDALRALLDVKIFVDVPADERLARRVRRDIVKRGYDVNGVLAQYRNNVRPMHEQFIEPYKDTADVIVPRGGKNEQAINILASYIHQVLSL